MEEMKEEKKRWGRKKIIVIAAMALFLLSLIPLPIREKDKEAIARQSLSALLSQNRVWIWARAYPTYRSFYDANFIDRTRTILYNNDIGIKDSVFEDLKLQKYDSEEFKDKALFDFYQKNILVELTYNDVMDETRSDNIHFNYYHGSMGAQGYRVKVYRNMWGCFCIFVFEWVS